MWRLEFLFSVLAGQTAAFAAPVEPSGLGSGTFSLEVAKKDVYGRDFVKDWAAAHNKCGNGVPFNTFSLAQGGWSWAHSTLA